jgi:hypothetical protein
MTSVSSIRRNENLIHSNFTVAEQNISISFSLKKASRLKFTCFALQISLPLLPGEKKNTHM